MRHIRLCIWMLLLSMYPYIAHCQNLVPNPSFEDYNVCPNGISGIDFSPAYTSFPTLKDWVNPLKYTSPDYCNVCAVPASGVHIPEVAFGYQRPKTGQAYAGIILWEESTTPGNTYSFGEYLETKLTTPMLAGQDYCVSFYVSATVTSNLNFNYMAMDDIGLSFSNSQVSQASGSFLSLPYHLQNAPGNYLTDTAGWIKVNGVYRAKGGEQWLTIGRFNSGMPAHTMITPATPNPSLPYRQYVYIDDVNVYRISQTDTVTGTHDSTYCSITSLPMHLQTANQYGDFTWSTGATTADITVTADGVYWCKNLMDCKVYLDTFIVKNDPNSKLNLGREIVDCNNGPVTIKANHPYTTYKWSTGASSPIITVTTPGIYWLQTTNACGTQADTVRVYIQSPTPKPAAHDTMICQLTKDPLLKDIKGQDLKWYTSKYSPIGSPIQPGIYTKDVNTITYYITQTIGKCESEKVPVNIDIRYTPKHELDAEYQMCVSQPISIGNHYPDVKYYWSTGEQNCCIVPRHEGFYRLVTSNECGTYGDSTQVVFNPCEECLAVPNAFTPDGDDVNDKFGVFETCPISQYHISIYNRWGQRVFESRDVKQQWTGTIEGRYLERGVYVYVIEYTPETTHINKILKGTISLLR